MCKESSGSVEADEGGWRDKRSGEYGSPKIRVARFQKRHGRFTPQSKFNISSLKQAKQFVDVLNQWMAEMGEAESGEEE